MSTTEQPTAEQHVDREPSATVTLRPTGDDEITLTAESYGMAPARVAYGLRMAADTFDVRARAAGDEPIPYPTAEQRAAEAEARQLRAIVADWERRAGQAPALDPAQVRAAAFEEAAAIAEKVAAEMRQADGTWPEEWSSREVRDAVESAAGRIRAAAAEQPAAVEEPPADWVADVRAAIAFNLPEREPALETLRDVLLDTAPRTPEQALAAARLILAAHTRDQVAAVRKHVDAYRAEHGVNRSTRGLITGMDSIRRLLDQRADALDAEAQP